MSSAIRRENESEWDGSLKAKEAKKKNKSENKIGVGIQQPTDETVSLKLMGKVMVCQMCKWKSTPCVLHFNLTSFHSRPNHCQQNERTSACTHIYARVSDIQCCFTRVSFFFGKFCSLFLPVTTINHFPTIFRCVRI